MDGERMSNADMLQYCDEALAWEDFGPIDIFFFESVKRILLGECSPIEEEDNFPNDLMGVERPVRDVELEPEYDKFADIYYEEGDEELPDYTQVESDVDDRPVGEYFSDEDNGGGREEMHETEGVGFTVNI
ncbi:MAG: hypothetical protein K6A79_08100 [Ruminococcus sp.]|nr:hypothetical protein [Ruminococcus sp.]MCR5075746.1 hypothetical protein [Ruminococcus sp.]